MAAPPRPHSAPDHASITPGPDGSFYTSIVSNAFPPPPPQDGPEPSGTRPGFGSAPPPPPPPPPSPQAHWAFATPPPPPPPAGYYYGGVGADDPLVSTDLSSWFSKVFAGMRRSWKSLLIYRLIALVPSILVAIALRGVTKQIAQPSRNVRFTIGGGALVLTMVSYLSSIVIYAVSTAASAHVLAHDALSESQGSSARVDWQQGLRFGFSRVLPMIGWSLATGLLVGVGFLFCLVPGIYLGVIFFGTLTGVVAFERPSSVVSRCFELMKGNWWEMFGRALLVVVGLIVVSCGIGLLSGGFTIATSGSTTGSVGSIFASSLLNIPIAMFLSVAAIVTYAELRRKLEPISSAQLAAESAIPG